MINQSRLKTNKRVVSTILDMVIIEGTQSSSERDKKLFKILQEEGFLSKNVKSIRVYSYLNYKCITASHGFSITIVETFESYSTRRTTFYFDKEFIQRWWE